MQEDQKGADAFEHGDKLLGDMRSAAAKAADVLSAIGSPFRLMILCMLMDGEKTVTELSEEIGMRQSLASQHLTRLRLDELVQSERRGHFVYYSLHDPLVKDLIATLHKHFCADGGRTRSEG